jgi:hypothetical protein
MGRLALFIFGGWNDADGVLALATKMRCDAAFRCWVEAEEGGTWEQIRLYVSGGTGAHFNSTATNHGELVLKYLLGLGIPPAVLVVDSPFQSIHNTVEEAIGWATLLEEADAAASVTEGAGLQKVICFTNAFHQPRCKHLLHRVFALHPRTELQFGEVDDAPCVDPTHKAGVVTAEVAAAAAQAGASHAPPLEFLSSAHTTRTSFMPLGKWRAIDFAAMRAHEAKGLAGLETAPFGVWKEWLHAHPLLQHNV